MSSELRDQMGCDLPNDWKLGGPSRGARTSSLEKHANFLLTLIERQSDLTLDEVVCVLRKQGIRSSRTSVWRFFKRHNITFKKNPARGGAATRRRSTGASALDASTGHV